MTEVNMTENNYFLKLGQNIKRYRQQRNLTVAELAKIIKTRELTLSQIEEGQKIFTMKTLEKIVKALGVTFEEIFDCCEVNETK